MPTQIDDELWAAVGDPTRRRVLDLLLADGPDTASGLSRRLPVSRQAIAKQLGVLERAGLVVAAASSREVRFGVDPAQFARAVDQLAEVGQLWGRRLHRIKILAESVQQERDAAEAPHVTEPAD